MRLAILNHNCLLNKKKISSLLPIYNINISLKILCNFTRRYKEISDYIEYSSIDSLIETKEENGKKKYTYDKEKNINKIFDLPCSLDSAIENYIRRIKIYPFMQNHEVRFNYAAIIIFADIGNKVIENNFIVMINYTIKDKKERQYRNGTLKESILICGPIFHKIIDVNEVLETFEANLLIK